MITQNTLFSLASKKREQPKAALTRILSGMYYDPAQELYISYSNNKKLGEWTEEHFKEVGFTKEAMRKVRERVL